METPCTRNSFSWPIIRNVIESPEKFFGYTVIHQTTIIWFSLVFALFSEKPQTAGNVFVATLWLWFWLTWLLSAFQLMGTLPFMWTVPMFIDVSSNLSCIRITNFGSNQPICLDIWTSMLEVSSGVLIVNDQVFPIVGAFPDIHAS